MIWTMIIIALTTIWAGWKISKRSGRALFFWLVVISTALFIGGLIMSHNNIIEALWYKRALSIYSLLYLVIALTAIIWWAFWKWRKVSIGLTALLCIAVIYGFFEHKNIQIEAVEIESDRLPKEFEGFRIALFSDMHLGSMIDQYSMIEQLVSKINELEVDMVINCGDLVTYKSSELDKRTMDILGRLKAKYGIWSILGNHDMGLYHTQDTTIWHAEEALVRQKELSMGWRLLDNSTDYVIIGNDSLAITGLNYPDELIHRSHNSLKNPVNYRQYYDIDTTRFNITLSHAPQPWEALIEQNIATDLTLSGHVHAMQMKVFGLTPASLLYKRTSGLYTEGSRSLYINDGIGSIIVPLRLGAQPEITLITLHR